jgi:hypothetical protein
LILFERNSNYLILFKDEINSKRKFHENEIRERKKRCGIWSLADMAEKNHNKNKINQPINDKQDEQRRSSSISSSSSCSSPTSSQGFTSLFIYLVFHSNFYLRKKSNNSWCI